jgi:NTP pyrophosphatase (non-canonical NTP hydrolase)
LTKHLFSATRATSLTVDAGAHSFWSAVVALCAAGAPSVLLYDLISGNTSWSGNVKNQEAPSDLSELRELTRQFANERDWGKFHTPKNLATALSIEASELLEPFQWLLSGDKDELDNTKLVSIRHEMADVLIYLIFLADKLDVNLYQAVREKMEINRVKYPANKVRGDSRKYSEYE